MKYLERFSKNPQISNLMKIRPVGAELLHTYTRTDGRTWRIYIIIINLMHGLLFIH